MFFFFVKYVKIYCFEMSNLGDVVWLGHKARNADGGNLVRQVRESRHSGLLPYLYSRRYDNK